jgi:Putative Flp pilus-assembly TadE/G-like
MKLPLVVSTIRYLTSERGSTSVFFALGSVAVIGAAGAAVDYSRAQYEQSRVQGVLDAALIAGVSSSVKGPLQETAARAYFASNIGINASSYTAQFSTKKSQLRGTVRTAMQTSLMKAVGVPEVKIDVHGVAVSNIDYEPLCFGSMHPHRKHTMELKGSVSVLGPDCNFYGNSDHKFDVVDPHTPANFLTGKYIAAIGGGHHELQNVTPPVEFGAELIEDPMASLESPLPPAACQPIDDFDNVTLEIPAGHYCKGLRIRGNAKVTLKPGEQYFISGGPFQIENSELVAEDVTVFLKGARANINWVESSVRISASAKGAHAGIAIQGDRIPTENYFTRSQIDIYGIVYMLKGAFTWDNDGDFTPSAAWTAFVVDGVSWIGNGTIRYNFNIANATIPYPDSLVVVPRPGNPRLLK